MEFKHGRDRKIGILAVALLLGIFTVQTVMADSACLQACDSANPISGTFRFSLCLVLRAIQLFGVLIAMIVMLIAGIKWIATESPEQRKVAKSYMFYSLLALIVVLLVTQFINAIIAGATGISIGPASIVCEETIDSGIDTTIRYAGCMVFNTIKLMAMILAVLATLYVGIKLMSTDDPEERSVAKMIMLNVLIGVVIVILTTSFIGPIITKSGAPGFLSFTCEEDLPPPIKTTVEYVGCIFYWIFLILAVALAILVISLAGLRWMLSDTPEARRSAKNMILYAIVGAIVAILAWQIIGTIIGTEPFGCVTSPDSDIQKLVDKVQYTACIFIELVRYSVAGIATILIAIAGLIWMFSEDPETRTKAKWLIGHVIIGALIIMAAMFFINALVNYGGGGSGLPGEYIQTVSCNCIDDWLLDDEIEVTVNVKNPGTSSATFDVCVDSHCESKSVAAGATESVTITSDWDPGWALPDLGGSFSVTVKSSGSTLETYGPVTVPDSVSSDGDCCEHSGATVTGGGGGGACVEESSCDATCGATGYSADGGTTCYSDASCSALCGGGGFSVAISHSHAISHTDELDVTVTIENTGAVDGEFTARLYNHSGSEVIETESVDVAAGGTGSVIIDTVWNGDWDACNMDETYYFTVEEDSEGDVGDGQGGFTQPSPTDCGF